MIHELRELIIPYKKNPIDPATFFSPAHKSESLVRLYQGLMDDPTTTLEDLAALTGYASADLPGFKSLCYRLRDKLLDGLLSLPYKSVSPLRKNILKVQKLFMQGLVLQHGGQIRKGVEVLERAVKRAIKYEQYEIAYLALPYITKYYAFQKVDERRWKNYQKKFDRIKLETEGLQLSQVRYNVVSHFGVFKNKSHATELDQHLERIIKEFEDDEDKYSAYRYINRRVEIEQFYLLRRGDYEACIHKTDLALAQLSTRPFFNLSTKYSLNCAKVDALLNLNRYQEALDLLLILEEEGIKSLFNWYKLQRQKALVYAMMRDYDQLHDLTVTINKRCDLDKYNETLEFWKIIEAYVVFLVKAGRIDRPTSGYHSSYRLGRFLNEVPTFSKDKQGLNTAILIAQILYYIVTKKLEKIENRIETLSKYCYRYLRKDETYRSNCFIKMLARLPEAEFNPKRTSRYVHKYAALLTKADRVISTDVFDSEIIPYEDLWHTVTKVLPSKGYKQRTTSSAP